MIALVLVAVVIGMGAARITLAISVDEIGRPIRERAGTGWFGQLVSCTDCLSFWVVLASCVAAWIAPLWTALFMFPWALSLMAAFIARRY